MKNKFVADGLGRFMRAKQAVAAKSTEKKYAAELANANPIEGAKIRERMAKEILTREKMLNHRPSSATLW